MKKMLLWSRFYARAASSRFSVSRKCCNQFHVFYKCPPPGSKVIEDLTPTWVLGVKTVGRPLPYQGPGLENR